uniref:FRA10A associated CGG repeat 1 n=1 Tax=Salmo trutta TaxID=8032 RepID=A0A673ZUJ6_SALTR
MMTERLLFLQVHGGGGYDSDFSDDEGQGETSQRGVKRKREDDLLRKPFQKGRHTKVAHRDVATHEYDREEARNRRHHLISMNAFERHKKFVSDYILYYGGKMEDLRRSTANDKSDLDVVRENHRFLWRDEDEEEMTWEKELAKKYYDKLFKEYCIADLSRYKENKFGFRWRVEKEVVSGKGQFLCGNKRCEKEDGLKSWEVNFAYVEQGEKRNALVKLRLCPECSFKLNYHHNLSSSIEHVGCLAPFCAVKMSQLMFDFFQEKGAEGEHSEEPDSLSEADHWKGPAPTMEEKSREEKFDEYFEDMFL